MIDAQSLPYTTATTPKESAVTAVVDAVVDGGGRMDWDCPVD
jgi:hypothetical protein